MTTLASEKKKFYVTTAINYTNGPPHFGHAYEVVAADALARYHRICGDDVFFMTGTDEHGQKVAETAESQGLKPIELCNKYVSMFQSLNKSLNISNDFYIRTTLPKHYKTCQWIWEKVAASGDIYLGEYSGWYCIREERFFSETEAKALKYVDPGNGKPLIKRSESSYFFKLSKYKDQLLKYIDEHPDFILPEERREEIVTRLKSEDLLDLSISRATFDWGVPVPESAQSPNKSNEKHVMYVWFDALTNYLTGVDYPNGSLSSFWPANVHLIGKDIVWFHAVIWPAMLLSAGVPLPKTILCHGFVCGPDGRKMSKSYGNVVDPVKVLENFDSDALRYFVLHDGTFGSDFNFSVKSLIDAHDFNLAASYGNLVQRAISLTQTLCSGEVPSEAAQPIFSVEELKTKYLQNLDNYNFRGGLATVFEALRVTNHYLTNEAPWNIKVANENDQKKIAKIVRTVLEAVYICSVLLSPVLPKATGKLFAAFNTPLKTLPELNGFSNLVTGTKVAELQTYLFERIQGNRFSKQAGSIIVDKTDDRMAIFINKSIVSPISEADVITFQAGDRFTLEELDPSTVTAAAAKPKGKKKKGEQAEADATSNSSNNAPTISFCSGECTGADSFVLRSTTENQKVNYEQFVNLLKGRILHITKGTTSSSSANHSESFVNGIVGCDSKVYKILTYKLTQNEQFKTKDSCICNWQPPLKQ